MLPLPAWARVMGAGLALTATGCGRVWFVPFDGGRASASDAAIFDAAIFDASILDASGTDAAGLDAAGRDAAGVDASSMDAGADAAGLDGGRRVNLVVNGDAEDAPGSTNGAAIPTPGWASSGGATAVLYGAPTYPTSTSPGPVDRGASFLSGGRMNRVSSLSQDADVTAYAPQIDSGVVGYTLAGWLGGYDIQPDTVVVTASFLDGSGLSLGSSVLGPISVADRGSVTGFVERSTSGALPAGTRTVRVRIEMERLDGQSADGYVDNLELWLDSI